jgi:hypothetical protein
MMRARPSRGSDWPSSENGRAADVAPLPLWPGHPGVCRQLSCQPAPLGALPDVWSPRRRGSGDPDTRVLGCCRRSFLARRAARLPCPLPALHQPATRPVVCPGADHRPGRRLEPALALLPSGPAALRPRPHRHARSPPPGPGRDQSRPSCQSLWPGERSSRSRVAGRTTGHRRALRRQPAPGRPAPAPALVGSPRSTRRPLARGHRYRRLWR